MKNLISTRLIAFCFLIFSLSYSSIGQSDEMGKPELIKMSNKSLKERISLSPSIGWLHSWDDFKDDRFMPSFLQPDANKVGFGLNVNYKIKDYLSLSTGILIGKLEGRNDIVPTVNASNNSTDYGRGILYKTNLFEFTLPRVDLNVTKLIFKDRVAFFNKASIGIFASHGLVFYDSKIYPQDGTDVNLLYSKTRGRTGKTTEAVTSFGGKFSYMINEKFDIGLESSIRNVYNDKLDAWVAGDYNDKYSYTAVSFTYHLKRKSNNKKKEVDKLLAKKPGQDEIEGEREPVLEEETKTDLEDKEDVLLEDAALADETVFGVYNYDKLAMSNTALIVLDENGNPIDTIYTDASGNFKYTKLSIDQKVSFYPLDSESLDDDKIKLFAENNKGAVVQDKRNTHKKKEVAVTTEEKKVPSNEVQITGYRYYVVVAAFRGETSTGMVVDQLKKKGANPVVIRNLKDTWNLVTVAVYDNKAKALEEMKKAREEGHKKSWVHILPPVK